MAELLFPAAQLRLEGRYAIQDAADGRVDREQPEQLPKQAAELSLVRVRDSAEQQVCEGGREDGGSLAQW